MDQIRRIIYYFTVGCGILLIIVTFLSLFHTSLWYLEILNFPRLAILIALTVCLLFSFVLSSHRRGAFFVFTAGLLLSIIVQAWIISPYTPLSRKTVRSADADEVTDGASFSIFIANVLMNNRNATDLLKMINETSPDIVLTMEVDNWWDDELSVLKKKYPYHILFPTDNTYGMCLYSKLPLTDSRVLFLNEKNVPSFHCMATLNNGKQFQLLTIHPVAPVPSEHPDNMGEKGNALLKAGRLLAAQKKLTVVAGDFNDVGWSYNTSKFSEICKLNDVRCGRSLYNTFNAQSFIMKWPLDHIYVSDEFKVLKLQRMPSFGSDHYPLYAELACCP